MRYSVALFFSVSAVGCLLPGCVADHASAIDESDTKTDFVSQLPDKPANPDDPYGACVDDPDDGVDDLACSIPGLTCLSYWGDFGAPAGEGQREDARLWATCSHPCEEDSQCPVPTTGDAVPKCLGECMLPCEDEGTVCPDGFMCSSPSEVGSWTSGYDKICVQYFHYEPFAPTSLEALGLSWDPLGD